MRTINFRLGDTREDVPQSLVLGGVPVDLAHIHLVADRCQPITAPKDGRLVREIGKASRAAHKKAPREELTAGGSTKSPRAKGRRM